MGRVLCTCRPGSNERPTAVTARLGGQAAEDITAETFLLAFDLRDRFDLERGGLWPWLFGFATNLVVRHRHKEARRYKAPARLDPAPVVERHDNRVVASVAAVAAAAAGVPRSACLPGLLPRVSCLMPLTLAR
ncbi:RNA polymerase sigma factor [Nonomuraea sp. NPDC003214]